MTAEDYLSDTKDQPSAEEYLGSDDKSSPIPPGLDEPFSDSMTRAASNFYKEKEALGHIPSGGEGTTAEEFLSHPIGGEIPRWESQDHPYLAATANTAGGVANFMRTPAGLALIPASQIPGAPTVLGPLFAASAAKGAAQELGQASVTKDKQQAAEGFLNAAAALLMGAGALHKPTIESEVSHEQVPSTGEQTGEASRSEQPQGSGGGNRSEEIRGGGNGQESGGGTATGEQGVQPGLSAEQYLESEEPNATPIRPQPVSGEQQHPGTPSGATVPADEAQVREVQGGQSGNSNKPDEGGVVAPEKVTEANVENLPPEQQAKLGHGDGIEYGLTLSKEDVPRLQKKYDAQTEAMKEAFKSGDSAGQLSAFGKANFYGGALMGATRGEHPISGTNFEGYMKLHPEAAPEIVGMGGAKYGEVGSGDVPGLEKYGIAERVREERAAAGQVAPVEPGQGINTPDSIERGRTILENNPDAAEAAVSDFEKTGKFSSDTVAVARARGEQLAYVARRIEEKFGTESNEYKRATKALSDWDARTKKIQTEWHKSGMAQQGETDIDTGTYTGLQRAFKNDTGKDFTPEQADKAKRIAKASQDAETDAGSATDKLLKEIEKHPEDVFKRAKLYIEQGMENFDDIVTRIATDMGKTRSEIITELSKVKQVKRLADDAWKKQSTLRRVRQLAKRWVLEQQLPAYRRAIEKIPRALFALKVGFHGTVALGTHAPMVAFQPEFWKTYATDFGKMYKMVGSPAYYERQVQDLLRRPNYIAARRAGLINDPSTYEDFNSPDVSQWIGNLTGMGNRGYTVLKILRQDMFDQHWNNLPEGAKIPEVAKAIADGVNHATGVVRVKAPKGANIALFAPRLEASRAAWLAVDPAKAVDTFLRWKSATAGEKQFAIMQAKEKAWVAGTALAVLALNQGILSAMGSKQKINLTNPMQSDFLKFKAGGMDFSYGNAMLSMGRFPARLYLAVKNEGKLNKIVYEDENVAKLLLDYARSQASPLSSLLLDLGIGRDFEERPLPRAGFGLLPGKTNEPKRLQARGEKPYTWTEYLTERALPIPFEEATRDVWKHGLGMSDDQIKAYMKAVAKSFFMAGTGSRLSDDYNMKPHAVPYLGEQIARSGKQWKVTGYDHGGEPVLQEVSQ